MNEKLSNATVNTFKFTCHECDGGFVWKRDFDGKVASPVLWSPYMATLFAEKMLLLTCEEWLESELKKA